MVADSSGARVCPQLRAVAQSTRSACLLPWLNNNRTGIVMNECTLPVSDAVIERALQGYAPEDVQQATALVSSLQSVLPLEDCDASSDNPAEILA